MQHCNRVLAHGWNCQTRGLSTSPQRHQQGAVAEAECSATGDSEFLQGVLSGILAPYWERTPSAEGAVELLEERLPAACIKFDHLAFRSFGLPHLGIRSTADLFLDLGYRQRDELAFPAKKLRAFWYSPPEPELPRVFVDALSPEAQAVVRKYAGDEAAARVMGKYSALSCVLGILPWAVPSKTDYDLLARESEYAAWVLVSGSQLNHAAVAVHALEGLEGGIDALNATLLESDFLLNEDGGLTKVSPDGLLKQSSTMADRVSFTFAEGDAHLVPGSYIEFAERLVLPEFAHLPAGKLEERHRRDGFETSNADHIFTSTFQQQQS
eukprot:scaffold2.g7171.t1